MGKYYRVRKRTATMNSALGNGVDMMRLKKENNQALGPEMPGPKDEAS
jgi:hypothetical protein